MSSILTNTSAMNALSTLRDINSSLNNTQSRISSGLKVSSGKDNASYFTISTTMKSESGMYGAINEGMTLAKNSIATARLGAETLTGLAQQFVDRLAFAQEEGVDHAAVGSELAALVEQMKTTIDQSSFNGENMISTAGTTAMNGSALALGATVDKTVTTGITRTGATLGTTTQAFATQDLELLVGTPGGATAWVAPAANATFDQIAANLVNGSATELTQANLASMLQYANDSLATITDQATSFGIAEKAIENQQTFLSNLTDKIDTGVSSMIDADMEEEAARLQALQVQQQLATQSLSIANQAPQNLLSLFQ